MSLVPKEHPFAFIANDLENLTRTRAPLLRAVRTRGRSVQLVAPAGQDAAPDGARHEPWDVSRHGLNPLRELAAVRDLRRVLREADPALVHAFTMKPNVYAPLALGRGARTPVVATFSGLGWLFSRSRKAAPARALAAPALRRVLRAPHVTAVFQNTDDLDRLRRLGLLPEGRGIVIPGSGVDVERFSPPAKRPDPPYVVLLAARLLQDKGVPEFVAAAARVAAVRKDVEFWVAGERDPQAPTCIPEDRLDAWRKQGLVRFLGHVSDMPSLLRRAHVAVLPTSYGEGLPRFLLEAAATGLPLVASSIGACRMVVEDGANGRLIPHVSAEAIADAVLDVIDDEPRRARMGAASRKSAVSTFATDHIVAQYVDLYASLGAI